MNQSTDLNPLDPPPAKGRTVYVQVFLVTGEQVKEWPLPQAGEWTPWRGERSDEGQTVSMAAHRLMRSSGYMHSPTENSPACIHVRVYHAVDGDPWNKQGTHPRNCRFTDFTFRKN